MLTAQHKAEAQKKLKSMASQMEQQKIIKQIIKNNTKAVNDLILSLKDDPKAQKNLLIQISNKMGPKILALQRIARGLQEAEQKMKGDKERMNKQKLFALQDKQRLGLSVKELQQTIKRIQQTVKSSVDQEEQKRKKIEDDMQKSLGQIQEKIVTFNKQSEQMQIQNQGLKIKKKQIQEKMTGLQVNFKVKAEQKDEEVRKQKQELMVKLQSLEGEVSEISEINKQFSGIQKGNFDKKLSLYLKGKKFPQYSTSFENSAKTIDQCKQQLLKGVQRMNDAKQVVQRFEKQSKQLSNQYLLDLKKKVQTDQRVDAVKKQKQQVRQRIISLQTRLKEKKNQQQQVKKE